MTGHNAHGHNAQGVVFSGLHLVTKVSRAQVAWRREPASTCEVQHARHTGGTMGLACERVQGLGRQTKIENMDVVAVTGMGYVL